MMDVFYLPETSSQWEVHADAQWLFVRKKTKSARVAMSDLLRCIVSHDYYFEFRLIIKGGKKLEFHVGKKRETAQALFTFLERFCPEFRNMTSTFTPWQWKVGIYHYRLDRYELAVDVPRVFHQGLKPFYRIPVRDIVWVTQHHSEGDPEAADTYYLRVYLSSGKFYDLEGDSVQHCYNMARMIKDNAPQVRYGVHCGAGLSGLNAGYANRY